MRRLNYLWLCLCILSFTYLPTLKAQVITSNPEFPTATGSVTITFYADKGNQGLKGYTGDVYMHTGVITNKSTSSSDWKYVKTSWGENTPETKLTKVETDVYTFTISNPMVYYGVPGSEKIEQLAFVFRSSDSKKEGKDTGNKDIFQTIYESTLNVKFTAPDKPVTFVKPDAVIEVKAVVGYEGTGAVGMELKLNDALIATSDSASLFQNVTFTKSGVNNLKVIGFSDSGEKDSTSIKVVVKPNVASVPRPYSFDDGVTDAGLTGVMLSLFAPHKEFVYVIGDFNDYQIDDNYLMNKDVHNADSTWFWLQIDGLETGKEYGFQYFVDGELRVADPYSYKILDPNDDRYIPENVYPNLKPYPVGKTEEAVGVFEVDKPAFAWQVEQFLRPDKEKLVIYELLLRDFLEAHSYTALKDTLNYLSNLGINAIELMPVMEFEGNESWGYNPSFHLALDKYYGTETAFKEFIDAAHGKGIAVILDIALNHAFGQSPLVRLWNEGSYGKPTSENPYLNPDPKHDFNVGYDFNHESAATQYFVDRVTSYWMKEFKIDGFRFDLSKGFTQKNTLGNTGAWGQYDASRVRLLSRMANKIWEIDPNSYVILEHFAENSEEIELSNRGMMLWGNMNHNYTEAAMGWLGESNFSGVSWKIRNWQHPNLIGFMESHDEERMMYKNLQFGNENVGIGYSVKNLETALDRTKMAGALFFLIPGPKMIWQFGELGYDFSIEYNGRVGNKPIRWDYYSDENRQSLYKTWSALIKLRNSDPLFTSESSLIGMAVSDAVKRVTLIKDDDAAVIVGNFDVAAKDWSYDFPKAGTWFDYFTGAERTIPEGNLRQQFNLEPGQFYVFTNKKFETPDIGLGTAIDNKVETNLPQNFRLHQNYPNPFNPSTMLTFETPVSGKVSIEVFDMLGRKITTLVNSSLSAGTHQIQWDASNLSSGIYLIRMSAGSSVQIIKTSLIK